jgi:pimeloyl-ACP methyl ester carboxylesterase
MRTWIAIAAAFGLAQAATAAQAAEPPGRCHVGVYRLADGALVDVAPTKDAMRWRLMDGRSGELKLDSTGGFASTLGWTGRPDGVQVAFGTCEQDRITFAGQAGQKLKFKAIDTTFMGDGVKLAGRLVLPEGDGPVPISILVHGSEDYSGRDRYFEQRAWPAQGVGIFVYDKRGTGASDGKYTQDFRVLARDAVAAVKEARRLAGARAGRVGLDGGSQGGWIAPLAASQTPVDYVIVRFGMAESALAEDRSEVLLGLQEKGYGEDVLAKARKLTDVTGKIMATRFEQGWDELDALRQAHGQEPWFKDVEGEYSGEIVHHTRAEAVELGRKADVGTSWDYEPLPVLQKLDTPMLWILAGSDREAPVEETRRRLLALAKAGRPITVIEFPKTDHGILEFETAADGERTPTRYADGYFRADVDYAKTGTLPGRYGAALRLAEAPARP